MIVNSNSQDGVSSDARLPSEAGKNSQGPAEGRGERGQFAAVRRLLSFDLSLKSPWLDEYADQQDELQRLAQNCRDQSHSSTIGLMDKLLAMCTLTFEAAPGQRRSSAIKNMLVFGLGGDENERSESHQMDAKYCAFTWRRFYCLMILIFVAYCSISLVENAYVILQHDIMVTNMKPVKRPRQGPSEQSSNQTNVGSKFVQYERDCALKDEIQLGRSFDGHRYARLVESLSSMGVTVLSQVGSNFFATIIIGLSPLTFYFLPLIFVHLKRQLIRVDTLVFIRDPLGERCRLARDLEQILAGLARWFEITRRENALQDLLDSHEMLTVPRLSSGLRAKPYDHKHWREASLVLRACRQERQIRTDRSLTSHWANLEFAAILEVIRERKLVRPVVSNSDWHWQKLQLLRTLLILFVSISVGFPLAARLMSELVELYVRVFERLRLVECARWNPRAITLKPDVYLEPLSSQDQHEFHLHDGSLAHLTYLALVVEARNMFSIRSAAQILKSTTVVCFLSAWSTFWTLIYVLGFLDLIAWLLQIKTQLIYCKNISLATLKQGNSALADAQLLQALTIALVNYSLFRRQYKPFRMITNFLLFQAAVFTGSIAIELYLIAVNVETRFKSFTMFASICVISLMNIYLVISSYTTKLVEKVMRLLISSLGILAHYPDVNIKPVLNIWRRQLLTEWEVELFASTRVINFFVSYKKIVAFNMQLVAIWLLLWKVIGN